MKKKTILVVDDDRAVADSLRKLLEAEKFNVSVAIDGAEAIGHFQDQSVDLVVLDINLGNDNGWEVLLTMQQIKPGVPTIVITAEFGQHDQAIAAGAEALIEKPIDVSSFLDLIHHLLEETSQRTLERVHHDPEYCRYVGKDGTFLRLLQERQSAPLDLSTEISAALPDWRPAARPKVHNPQTVVGDPTATGV